MLTISWLGVLVLDFALRQSILPPPLPLNISMHILLILRSCIEIFGHYSPKSYADDYYFHGRLKGYPNCGDSYSSAQFCLPLQ